MVKTTIGAIELYQDGYLNKLLLDTRDAVLKHNTSFVIVIDGRSGMGKTTLANQVGLTLDNNYDMSKIYYTPEDFKEGLKNAKKGDFLLFDEAMLISSRSALTAINRMIVQAMSMIRSKQIYVCFCVNSIFDLDKNLALSRADLLLHVYGKNLIDRGRFGAFFKASEQFQNPITNLYIMGKKYYSYAKPKPNFIGRFTKNFVLDESIYEHQKQKAINKYLSVGEGRAVGLRDIWLNKLVSFILDNKSMTAIELANVVGCNEKTIRTIHHKDLNHKWEHENE